jgi:hypothetical protein
MNTGRRHETPGSETKDVIICSNNSTQRIDTFAIFPSPSSDSDVNWAERYLYTYCDEPEERNSELKRSQIIYTGSKYAFPSFQRENASVSIQSTSPLLCLSLSSKAISYTHILRYSRTKTVSASACSAAKTWAIQGQLFPNIRL